MSIKEKIHGLIENIDDEKLLEEFYKLLRESSTVDNHDDLSEEQLKSLEQSLNDLDEGRGEAHEEAIKRLERWRRK